ncbi:MAG: hypothetical protein R2828_35005 [Saprospiraceae bacterium]
MVEFLNVIDQLLKKVLEETLKIKSEKSDCQKFYYEILFINIRLFEGAIFLLAQFEKKPLFQVSFVSVMRDLISNLILADYISYSEFDPSVNVDEELEKIYSEHYRFKKKSKKIERTLFNIYEDHAQFEEEFDKLGERYNGEGGGLKPHLKKIESTFNRIKYIESQQKKDDKYNVRVLYNWYTEFSKISHFGELTIRQVANKYNLKNEKEVFDNYGHLLKTVSIYIVGLLAKVCYKEPVEESIVKNLYKIRDFEIGT